MSNELKFLIELVKEAKLMITDNYEVKPKGNSGDLVTDIDYKIEEFFINKIKEKYPSFSIVSEEYNSDKLLTKNCFVIDPIDGTINFANHLPLWGIQIACIKDGEVCASVIYLVKLDELYYADEHGAFLNGKPLAVNNLSIENGLYSIEDPKHILGDIKFNNNFRKFYSAAVCFSFVASGRLSGVNVICSTPWDYIPDQYIVEKSGGVIYNDNNIHIAANSENFLDFLKSTRN